ncbi:YopT-type cysteine protease domain-containing protein [Oleomonas cavernae]|nr:YopT-type cysteine protease domain-containing protein [Oleomonas cavernae]
MPDYVFEYSQGADIRWYAGDVTAAQASRPAAPSDSRLTQEGDRWVIWGRTSTSFGVCFGLSAWWIIKKAKGEDFLAWLKAGRRANPASQYDNPGSGRVVEDVRAMQLCQRDKTTENKLHEAVARIKQETGLTNRDSLAAKTGALKDKEGYSLIILNGQFTTAPAGNDLVGRGSFHHAIAVEAVSPAEVYLFDPNRGEIKLSCVAEANQFIAYLCQDNSQYHLANFTMTWSAVAGHRIKKGHFN